MKTTRRQWMQHAGVAGIGTVAAGPAISLIGCNGHKPSPVVEPTQEFQHGVASGDPLPEAVIIWTRVTPPSNGAVDVEWEMAEDVFFERIVDSGTVTTSASRDYTVKVDVTGLQPGRTYFYRFRAMGGTSLVGRTHTAPTDPDRLRFALCSCQNFLDGWYHAYRRMAERNDIDAVVHVGDYIYESGGSNRRSHEPNREVLSLDDYRTRYAWYRRDRDLQAAHQMHPWIVAWDDHETANNAWKDGAENHESGEGSWEERKAIAYQAYVEWLPIREQEPGKIWRTFRFGDLAELIMLDTRRWGRDPQMGPRDDPDRQILGMDQEQWLQQRLTNTSAQWKVIGQQVMFSQLMLEPNTPINPDQWDGYPAARQRVFDMIEQNGLDDVVVLAGDIHSAWVSDLTGNPFGSGYDRDTGMGSLAVEFVTTSISSRGLMLGDRILDLLLQQTPHIKDLDPNHRGYTLIDITPERTQGEWWMLDGTEIDQGVESLGSVWKTISGENRLTEAMEASSPRNGPRRPGFLPEPMGTGGMMG